MILVTCEQHEELRHLRAHVDGCAEKVERGRVLHHAEVHQTQVVQDLPVERSQVVGTLQTADCLI